MSKVSKEVRKFSRALYLDRISQPPKTYQPAHKSPAMDARRAAEIKAEQRALEREIND